MAGEPIAEEKHVRLAFADDLRMYHVPAVCIRLVPRNGEEGL